MVGISSIVLLLLSGPAQAQVELPVVQDFEAEPECGATCGVACPLLGDWQNATTDDLDWTIDSGGTPSADTGPSIDLQPGTASGRYAYTEASGACSPGLDAQLLSPVLDVSRVDGAWLSFWYHQLGADMGSLSVDQQLPLGVLDGAMEGATGTLTSPSADFSVLAPGNHVAIVGSALNDGSFEVLSVVDPNTVVLDTDGAAEDESGITAHYFDPAGPWTLDVFGPVSDDLDAWQQVACVPLTVVGADTRIRIAGTTGAGLGSDMAIDALAIREALPIDVAVLGVSLSEPGCGDASITVSATVANLGLSELSGVPLEYLVDGATLVQETLPGTLLPCDVVEWTFTVPVDVSVPRLYEIEVSHATPADDDPGNDLAAAQIHPPELVASWPYAEDFEGESALQWRAGGVNPSWALGTPAKAAIQGAFSGSRAWVTGGLGAGTYNPDEASFVEGPCYDFSALSNPRIELPVWWNAESSWDGALLEASVDDGLSWDRVGDFGDELNWYTDDGVSALPGLQGWTGASITGDGSGGWVLAGHDLDGLAGEPFVRMRFRFGSDSAVQDDGFAFDDLLVSDNPAGLRITDATDRVRPESFQAGTPDLLLLAFDLEARVAGQDVDALEVDLGGLADADVDGLRLWFDDGDGAFDPALDVPSLDGVQPLAAGTVSFDTAAELNLPAYVPVRLYVSADLSPTAPPGAVFAASLDAAGVAVTPGPVLLDAPLQGQGLAVFAPSVPPLFDSFIGAHPGRTVTAAAGAYPEATAAGQPVTLGAPTARAGRAELLDDAAGVSPLATAGMLALSFPDGDAVAAVDHHLDLSGYSAAIDDVSLGFVWADLDEEDDDADGVFVSVDGGATWPLALHRFDPSEPGTWRVVELDLSAALADAGLQYSDEVVLRFQGAGASPLGGDGLLIDDVFVGTRPRLRVERAALVFDDGGTDDLGLVDSGVPESFTWTLHNDGDEDLSIASFSLGSASNLTGLGLSPPAAPSIPPGGSEPVSASFTVAGDGDFSFELSFDAGDPRLVDGRFDLMVEGTGAVIPDLSVSVDGAPITSGDTHPAGVHQAGQAIAFDLGLSNGGTGPLDFNGAAPVLFSNGSNVVAAVLGSPPDPLPPGGSSTVILELTPTADAAFSVDVLIPSDDPDTPVFAFTLAGTAVSPGLQVVRGSIVPSGGVDDAGALRVGTSATWGYTLRNTGSGDVTLLGSPDFVVVGNVAGPVSPVVTSQPPDTIPIGASVGFVLEYDVTGLGAFSFELVIDSNDADHPVYVVQVQGEGVLPDVQVRSGGQPVTGPVDLGDLRVGELASWEGEVANVGTGLLTLLGLPEPLSIIDADNVAAEVIVQPPSELQANAVEPLEVELVPTAAGPFSFTVSLPSDDPDQPLLALLIQGEAVEPDVELRRDGDLLADGAEDALGELRLGAPQVVVWEVGNAGSGPLALLGLPDPVAVANADGLAATVLSQPSLLLAPGAAESVAVELVATREGPVSVDLVVPNDDPDEPAHTVTITAVGTAPHLALRRGAIELQSGGQDSLGTLSVGVGLSLAWTIENVGTADLNLTGNPDRVFVLGESNVVALVAQDAPASLAPGEEADVAVQVTPLLAGSFSFDLVVASDDPDEPAWRVTVLGLAEQQPPELRVEAGETELAEGDGIALGPLTVGVEHPVPLVLANDGAGALWLVDLPPFVVQGASNLSVRVEAPDLPILAGEREVVQLAVTPEAEGPFSATLVFGTNDPGWAEARIELTGRGVAGGPGEPDPEDCNCAAAPGGGGSAWLLLFGLLHRRSRGSARG